MAVSSDTLRLAVAKETTAGTAPGGTYNLFRTTGEGLTYEITTTQSDEMGGINRGVKDSILTGATVTGEISFELSKFKALEDMMAACLGNDWGDDPISHPGTGANSVYDYQNLETFSIEKRFTMDDTPSYDYHLFVGCMVDTMTLNITPNEPITGALGFIGQDMTTEASEAGTGYPGAGTNPIMTAPLVTGIELLTPNGIDDTTGVPLGVPVIWLADSCFTGLTLTFANNGRGLQCISTLGNKETVLGRFEVSATGTLYYNTEEPLDALKNQPSYALRVTCADDDGESYEFFFPRVKFSAVSVLASGTNTDVMTEFSLQMLEYQGNDYAYSSMITRSSAEASGASVASTLKKKD